MTDRPRYYTLDAHGEPVPVRDVLAWGLWFQTSMPARIVAQEHVGAFWVSTVFLGLDHAFGNGPPVLFETMIFGGSTSRDSVSRNTLHEWRYTTRAGALAGHAVACEWARQHQPENA